MQYACCFIKQSFKNHYLDTYQITLILTLIITIFNYTHLNKLNEKFSFTQFTFQFLSKLI